MKSMLIVFIAIFVCFPLYGDTIKLKNGVTIDGKIVELTEAYLRIDRGHNNVYRLTFDQIEDESITKLRSMPKMKIKSVALKLPVVPQQPKLQADDVKPDVAQNIREKTSQSVIAKTQRVLEPWRQLAQEAQTAYSAKNDALAEKRLLDVLRIKPDSPKEVYELLTYSLYNQGKFLEAEASLEKAMSMGFDPDSKVLKALKPFMYRELSVTMPDGQVIAVKGKTMCDDMLLKDIVAKIMSMQKIPNGIVDMHPNIIKVVPGTLSGEEDWTVRTRRGEVLYSILLTKDAVKGTNFEILAPKEAVANLKAVPIQAKEAMVPNEQGTSGMNWGFIAVILIFFVALAIGASSLIKKK